MVTQGCSNHFQAALCSAVSATFGHSLGSSSIAPHVRQGAQSHRSGKHHHGDKGSATIPRPACHNHLLFFRHQLTKPSFLEVHFFFKHDSLIHLHSESDVGRTGAIHNNVLSLCSSRHDEPIHPGPHSHTLLKLLFLPIQASHQSDVGITLTSLEWKRFLQLPAQAKQHSQNLVFFF